jgi:S-adenosylmethionine-diacylglycerol 3-amino-3-carboxypropyl transferase
MPTEAAARADFTGLRYAQCWEDADILCEGLATQPGDVVLSIASAGDNSVALLLDDPARVVAVDLSPAQGAAVELRRAMYRTLSHAEFLALYGSRPSRERPTLYARCRSAMPADARAWWDARPALVAGGIGGAGKFERYFRLFRSWALPLVHRRRTVSGLLEPRDAAGRAAYFDQQWDTWRWRALQALFFSRAVMGRAGRDPEFFTFAEGDIGTHLRRRIRHALVENDPATNPYVHWILTGTHGAALPRALRAEHYETIRARIDRLELRLGAIEDILPTIGAPVARVNASDIFEYMSPEGFGAVLDLLLAHLRPGGRLAYWNLLAPRQGGRARPARLVRLEALSDALFRRDQAFFYGAFSVDEVRA